MEQSRELLGVIRRVFLLFPPEGGEAEATLRTRDYREVLAEEQIEPQRQVAAMCQQLLHLKAITAQAG
jgi:hypothetical protein